MTQESQSVQETNERKKALIKKTVVMLPALFVLFVLAFDHIRLYRHSDMQFYTLNRLINLFPFFLFVLLTTVKRRQNNYIDVAIQSGFNLYLYVLLSLTLFYIPFVATVQSMISGLWFEHLVILFFDYTESGLLGVNLTPFRIFADFALTDRQVMGNLVALFPLGFFLPILYKVSTFRRFILITFLITAFIEVTQFIVSHITPWTIGYYARSFDIDDLILNTVGASLGYLAFFAVQTYAAKNNISIPGMETQHQDEYEQSDQQPGVPMGGE